jgi:hypothetical protein
MFKRVAVCLDDLAPAQGAFPHAQEWAERLHAPLHLHDPKDPSRDKGLSRDPCTNGAALHVFGRTLPEDMRAEFLNCSPRHETPRLVCPDQWQPLSRMLVVHQDNQTDERFTGGAIRLCESLGARPIVLTVSHSERDVFARSQALQEALAGQGLNCEFDQFAGPDAAAAVQRVACWRRCQVVVLKRHTRRWLWPWRSADLLAQLTGLPGPLAFLVLPEEGLPDVSFSPGRPDATFAGLMPRW